VSDVANGVKAEYGLAEEGISQAQAAGVKLKEELSTAGIPLEKLHIFYSPFSRTKQTAEQVALTLGRPTAEEAHALRERYFGTEFELGSHTRYTEVWEVDAQDPTSAAGGTGESVQEVANRLSEFLQSLRDKVDTSSAMLLVSHGDTLQITQAMLTGEEEALKLHRSFALETGELRRLNPLCG